MPVYRIPPPQIRPKEGLAPLVPTGALLTTTMGGTLTPTGAAALKLTGKTFTGTVTLAGSIVRKLNKSVAATLTSAGAPLRWAASRTVTGAFSAAQLTGALARSKIISRYFAADPALAGIGGAGNILGKKVTKPLAATALLAGALQPWGFARTLVATLATAAPPLRWLLSRTFTGAFSAARLVGALVLVKLAYRTFTGTIASAQLTGAITRLVAKGFIANDPGVDPLTIATHVGAWIADDLSGADGSAIASWADASGNGRTATEATYRLLLYNNVVNGHKVARGDANAGIRTGSVTTGIGTGDWTVMAVLACADVGSFMRQYFSAGGAGRLPILYNNLNTRPGIYTNALGQQSFSDVTMAVGTFAVLTTYRRAGRIYLRRNRVLSGVNFANTFSFGDGALGIGGADNGAGSIYGGINGDLAEVHFWPVGLTDAEMGGGEQALMVKYGMIPSLLAGALRPWALTKKLTATLATAATLRAQIARTIPATLTTTATLARTLVKLLAAGGTLTPTAGIRWLLSRTLIASLTTTGATAKRIVRTLTATLTTAATPIRRVLAKNLAATLTTAGAPLRWLLARRITAALTPTGLATLQQITVRLFTATFTSAAVLVRQAGKALAATLATAGSTVLDRTSTTYPLAVSATLAAAGAVRVLASRAFIGALTPGGFVTLLKVLTRTFTGALAPAGAPLRWLLSRRATAAIAPTGSLIRGALHILIAFGTVTPFAVIHYLASRRFTATLTQSGVATVLKVLVRVFGGTLTTTAAPIRWLLSRPIAATLAPAAVLRWVFSRTVTAALATAANLVRQAQKRPLGALTGAGGLSMLKVAVRAFGGLLVPAGALRWLLSRRVAGIIAPAGAIIRQTALRLAGSLLPAGASARRVIRALTGLVAPVGALSRQAGKALAGAVSPTGLVGPRGLSRVFSGTLATSAGVRWLLRRTITGILGFIGLLTRRKAGEVPLPVVATVTLQPAGVAASVMIAPTGVETSVVVDAARTLAAGVVPASSPLTATLAVVAPVAADLVRPV